MYTTKRQDMVRVAAVVSTLLASIIAAQAAPQTYLLGSGIDPSGQYGKVTDMARIMSFSSGREVVELRAWQSWLASSSWRELIGQQMTKLSRNRDPDESLIINISGPGHRPELRDGESPYDPEVMLRAGVVLSEEEYLTFKELGELISDKIAADRTVKLIINGDFAGAAHQIAFNQPNICSVARTDFKSMLPDYRTEHDYGVIFWRMKAAPDFDKRNGISLAEAHLAGFGHDPWSAGRSQPSSLAYVDYLSQKGSYSEDDDANRNRYPILELEQVILSRSMGSPQRTILPVGKAEAYDSSVTRLLVDYDTVAEKLSGWALGVMDPLFHVARNVRSVHRKVQNNELDYEGNLRREIQAYGRLEDRFNSLSYTGKKARFAEFREMSAKHEMTIGQIAGKLYGHYVLAQQVVRVREFLQTATDGQKKKFEELLACEWGKL